MHEYTRYIGTIRYKEWTITCTCDTCIYALHTCVAIQPHLTYLNVLDIGPDIKVHARLRGVIDDDFEFLVQYRYTI
jgi:hypothetical protein